MSIIVCRVTTARDHENADSLKVYSVEAPGIVDPTQIIANKTNIYEVGDCVCAALIGTTLQDGTVIEKAKIRGILSFGMLLCKTNDAPVGTDLTVQMGATHTEKQVDESQGVVEDSAWPRYTSIDGFLRVRDEILARPDVIVTEKIHGSSWRFGANPSGKFVAGTHTARIIDSRMASDSWPTGHLIQKGLKWVEQWDIPNRVETYKQNHPEVGSLGVYGEICGYKCSDLHYGAQDSEVRLFGEVTINGQFLGYDAAMEVINELYPDLTTGDLYRNLMVPVLYRGKPDLYRLKAMRDQRSAFAFTRGVEQISEGIVIRPTTESVSKATLNRLIAKYKSPLYEERKSLRDKDPATLPVYITVYDLLADFVTEERIRHVFQRAEASGMIVEKKRMRDLGNLLYDDIRKESVGEWPAETSLDEGTLRRWTFDLAGEMLSKAIDSKS